MRERVAGRVGRRRERRLHDLGGRVDRGADRQVDDAVGVGAGAVAVRGEHVPGEVGQPPRERLTWKLPRGRLGGHDRGQCSAAAACGGRAATIGWSLSILPSLDGTAGRAEVVEELDVRLVVVLPLLGHVVLVEDRLDRADRLAGAAVDALVGVDVEHPLALVDAVDGALLDARLVQHVDARLGDDVGHRRLLLG